MNANHAIVEGNIFNVTRLQCRLITVSMKIFCFVIKISQLNVFMYPDLSSKVDTNVRKTSYELGVEGGGMYQRNEPNRKDCSTYAYVESIEIRHYRS